MASKQQQQQQQRFPTLAGKVAIVTGASRGIGVGLAEELAQRGAKVVLTYTSEKSTPKVDELIQKITSAPINGAAVKVRADISDPASGKKIVAEATKAFGHTIDILVNNAGVLKEISLKDMTPEDYHGIFDVNVRGIIFMTQAVLPHLPKKGGRIINLSSVGARDGYGNLSLYTSSKAAVEGLTRSWADELGNKDGHTVNAVCPGPVQSDMLDDVPKHIVDSQKAVTAVERRTGTIDDIAQIVAWLASEESRWVSGQCISASGGYAMY